MKLRRRNIDAGYRVGLIGIAGVVSSGMVLFTTARAFAAGNRGIGSIAELVLFAFIFLCTAWVLRGAIAGWIFVRDPSGGRR